MVNTEKGVKIEYSGTIREIGEYFQAKGSISAEEASACSELYQKDYEYPIKFHPLKLIAFVCTLLLCCSSLLLFYVEYNILFAINAIGFLLSLIIFHFVAKIEFPNEKFSGWGLLLLSFICALPSVLCFMECEEDVIAMIVFSIAFWFIGLVAGKRRLMGLLTPLIVCGGCIAYMWVLSEIDVEVAAITCLIYDLIALLLCIKPSGKENSERKAFNDL